MVNWQFTKSASNLLHILYLEVIWFERKVDAGTLHLHGVEAYLLLRHFLPSRHVWKRTMCNETCETFNKVSVTLTPPIRLTLCPRSFVPSYIVNHNMKVVMAFCSYGINEYLSFFLLLEHKKNATWINFEHMIKLTIKNTVNCDLLKTSWTCFTYFVFGSISIRY